MEEQKSELLQSEFEPAAAPPPEQVTVSLKLDAKVLDWLKAQPLGWQHELNNLARFYMETSNAPVPPPHDDHEADFVPFFE